MGERLLCKQEVIGSSPFTSTRQLRWLCRKAGGCGSDDEQTRQRHGFVTGGSIDRRWRLLMDNCEEASCVTEAGNRVRPEWPRVDSRTKCLLRGEFVASLWFLPLGVALKRE